MLAHQGSPARTASDRWAPRRSRELLFAASARRPLLPPSLTVLTYRFPDPATATSVHDVRAGEAAARASMARQLEWMCRYAVPVSLADVADECEGKRRLPHRALLVVVEDGLRSALRVAMPTVRSAGVPATVFVSPRDLAGTMPMLAEWVGYCFRRGGRTAARLPSLGARTWETSHDLHEVVVETVRWVRALPEDARRSAVRALARRLNVVMPDDWLAGPYLSWDEVRALADEGVAFAVRASFGPVFGGDRAAVHRHLQAALARLEAGTGRVVRAVAHCSRADLRNGRLGRDELTALGVAASFSVLPGPSTLAEVRRAPHGIRRVTVSPNESLLGLAMKLSGLPRLFPGMSS